MGAMVTNAKKAARLKIETPKAPGATVCTLPIVSGCKVCGEKLATHEGNTKCQGCGKRVHIRCNLGTREHALCLKCSKIVQSEPPSETRLVTIDDVAAKYVEPSESEMMADWELARSRAANDLRDWATKHEILRETAPELMGIFDEIDALGEYAPGGRKAAAE